MNNKYCKFCGKELKQSYDLDEHEYCYESCDCDNAVEIRQHKETIEDLKHQLKLIENRIWKHENEIIYLENKFTKYI